MRPDWGVVGRPSGVRLCEVYRRLSTPEAWQWPFLIATAVLLSRLFDAFNIGGALFMAPLLAGLIFALLGARLKVPTQATAASQALIGCVVARSLDMTILAFLLTNWLAVLFVILGTALASCVVAWGLFRLSGIDDETAAWGSMPGAASIMVTFAAEYGGDPRLVALMQYVRVIIVVGSASMAVSLLAGFPAVAPVANGAVTPQPSDASILDAGETMLVALAGIILGRLSKIPAGPLMVTMLIAATLHLNGVFASTLPTWMLAIAYGAIGLYVGLQFNKSILVFAVRQLPAILAAIAVLIALCGFCGAIFAWMLGVDVSTGYLATSPGAIDTIAILALESHANMSVVMAVQAIRFFAVIMTAPYLVKLIHLIGRRQAASTG